MHNKKPAVNQLSLSKRQFWRYMSQKHETFRCQMLPKQLNLVKSNHQIYKVDTNPEFVNELKAITNAQEWETILWNKNIWKKHSLFRKKTLISNSLHPWVSPLPAITPIRKPTAAAFAAQATPPHTNNECNKTVFCLIYTQTCKETKERR